MNSFTRSNKDILNQNIEEPLKNLFHLGGTMIIDKVFDIRNYLNVLERTGFEKKKNSRKLNILSSTSKISTFNSRVNPNFMQNSYLTTFNNALKSKEKFKKSGASFSTDMTKKYFNTDSSTNFYYKNIITNNNSNYNFNSTKNTANSLLKRNKNEKKYSPIPSNENFNVFKVIKEIKKSTQMPKIMNKKSPNKKLFITKIPNKERMPLAFSKEHVDTVFESKKVINNYKFRKGLELDIPDNIITFPTKKKEISVQNALISLLNKESKKLSIKEKDIKSRNEKNKKILDTNIQEFENFTDDHKKICKSIENCFDKLQKENNNLINELVIYKSLNKTYVEEIQKHLEQIENLRNYALFVHHSLEKDTTRYKKNIFPDYRYEKLSDYNKTFENICNFVIKNYSIFWDNKHREELKEELQFLEEPYLLLQKFLEIEGNIMRLLDMKNNIDNEMKDNEKEQKKIMNELQKRYSKAEKEYKISEQNLKIEMNLINNLKRKENDYNSEYIALIGKIFLDIVEILGENDKHKMNYKSILNGKIDKYNIDICIREGERILREKEDLLNNTLHEIKSYQEKDGFFFTKVMDETKLKNKMQKHLMYKKNKMQKQIENEKKFNIKANKFLLISRKTEAPYHSPQKKVKKSVNYALIKKLEDEELLKYD